MIANIYFQIKTTLKLTHAFIFTQSSQIISERANTHWKTIRYMFVTFQNRPNSPK